MKFSAWDFWPVQSGTDFLHSITTSWQEVV